MDTNPNDEVRPKVPSREMNKIHSTPSTSRSKVPSPSNGLKSSASETTTSTSPSIIPIAKRRGLLGGLTLIPELENPREYSISIKWLITIIVSAGAAVITTVRVTISLLSNMEC